MQFKKELEQTIARMLFLMHKSTFRARYIWFLDICTEN